VLLIFLLSMVGGSVTSVQAASTTTFAAGELLSRPTDHSIMISIVPDTTIEYHYQYGTSAGSYTSMTPNYTATGGQPHEIVISGLQANTQYTYRMRYHAPGDLPNDWVIREEHSFWTQRAPDSPFAFTIIADSHMSGGLGSVSLYQQTLANVHADHPDFHIDLGDTFWTDGVTSSTVANQRYLAQRGWMGVVSHSAPIFVAPGNHENEEGWNFDDPNSIALLSLNARKRYYPNPISDGFYSGNPDTLAAIDGDHLREDYFAWRWGDALFVFVDPYQYTLTKPYPGTAGGEVDDEGPASNDNWDWTLGQAQFNWLKQTLENSDAAFKFVFAHHMVGGLPAYYYVRGGAEAANLYEWGGYNSDGTTWGFATERSGWGDKPVHQLMVENHVSAFFYGHDHEYAYQARDGVVYQLVPAPSMTGYGFNLYKESDPHTIRVLPNSGHLRVTVTPEQATVDYIATTGGGVNYTYTIEPAPILTTAVSPPEGGTIEPAAGAHDYGKDALVSVTAAPAAGYIFDHWSGDCTGSGACQVVMAGDRSVTAHFAVSVGVAIEKTDENRVGLSWIHQAAIVDHYEVHRSLAEAHFAPDASSWLADATTATPAFTDDDPETGADLTAAGATYFYVVVPVNASGEPVGSSNRTAAFVFGLIPGADS